jgi:hypothetical protein
MNHSAQKISPARRGASLERSPGYGRSILSLTFHSDAAHCWNGGPVGGASAIYLRQRPSAMTHNEKGARSIHAHAPFLAYLWRRQPTTGRGRHLGGSVDAPGSHDRCGSAAGSLCAVRRRSPTQRQMMTSLPPTLIGRMMSGAEAAELILQLVEGRRRPKR